MNIKKLSNTEFTGEVYSSELPDKIINLLNYKKLEDYDLELNISGEYSVQWDDDIPIVTVKTCFVHLGNKEIELNDKDIDFDRIAGKLEDQNDGSWLEDLIASAEYTMEDR